MKPARTTESLRLYILPGCAFCVRVQRALEQLGWDIEVIDTLREPEARQYLMERRGRGTVPVLGIGPRESEQLLGESRDIIAYLREVAGKAAA